MQVCLELLSKIKKGSGPAFGAHFVHDFSIKLFLIQFSIHGQSFNATTYLYLKISNKMCYLVLIWTDDDVMLRFSWINFWSMAYREKRREDENTKI